MTNEELVRFHRRAKAAACSLGFHKHKEDLAQQVMANFLDGKNQHSTVGQATVDAVRQTIGTVRGGDPNAEEKKALFFPLELDIRLKSSIKDPVAMTVDDKIDFEIIIDRIKRSDHRAFAMLFFKWGFSQKEIGHVFDVTESRTSQILSDVERYLRKSLRRDING